MLLIISISSQSATVVVIVVVVAGMMILVTELQIIFYGEGSLYCFIMVFFMYHNETSKKNILNRKLATLFLTQANYYY